MLQLQDYNQELDLIWLFKMQREESLNSSLLKLRVGWTLVQTDKDRARLLSRWEFDEYQAQIWPLREEEDRPHEPLLFVNMLRTQKLKQALTTPEHMEFFKKTWANVPSLEKICASVPFQ